MAPRWLLEAVSREPEGWASYPDAQPARLALADHHRLDPRQILPCAGAADAFTLIARAFPGRDAVVMHPQFTEPELALRTAGHRVRRLLLRPEDGFSLNPGHIPAGADLVVIGNPTNPTGVLHRASEIRTLVSPGRILLVDEAFMDFVPNETETLLRGDLRGILVVRSLTKLWGIAGLRAGFVAGDPVLIASLAAAQEPWATSTPALDAMVECVSPRALAEAANRVRAVASEREHLTGALESAGFSVSGRPVTPFVLVDVSDLGSGSIPERLAEAGFAVRRGDTFPELGRHWIRVAVRDAAASDSVVEALISLRGQG